MITKIIVSLLVGLLSILINGVAFCGNILSYDETVNDIKNTMSGNTSDVRKESYGYININKCVMDYEVTGTYPVGGIYNIKYSNIDFSNINYRLSKTGHDYTAFIILNFDNNIKYNDSFKELPIRTIVINVSSDDKAKELFKAFLQLGEYCGDKTNRM